MMTRSPVMVTLCEGPEHIAIFKDSSLVYKLSVEEDVSFERDKFEIIIHVHVCVISIQPTAKKTSQRDKSQDESQCEEWKLY